jgi:hypothetical protein
VTSIASALDLAYQTGGGHSEKSREFALQFDADKVWDEKWLPFWRKVFA